MCGLTGFIELDKQLFPSSPIERLRKMSSALEHRGPDSSGEWSNEIKGIGLAHRRLSILDLSDAGHQPMESKDKRYMLSFNGEIYNHQKIRSDLKKDFPGIKWNGTSDSETLLATIQCYGIEKCIELIRGMFAIALWDSKLNILHLARDRLGEKPLYYGWQGKTFLFGSELKSLRAHPSFLNKINSNAVNQFIELSYIPQPISIYQDIFKLPSGTVLSIPIENLKPSQTFTPHTYWSLNSLIKKQEKKLYQKNITEAVMDLDTVLTKSIGTMMDADVPVGAFLSGGIDSSLIAALMQKQSVNPISTFTIGFEDKHYNESQHAAKVASFLETNHTEVILQPNQALDVIDKLPHIFDEPFGDSSQIPTYLVSSVTKAYVGVALSGDAGDEVFGGYNRYIASELFSKLNKYLPLKLRKKLAVFLKTLPPQVFHYFLSLSQVKQGNEKIRKIIRLLDADNIHQAYSSLVLTWDNLPADLLLSHSQSIRGLNSYAWPDLSHNENSMMLLDTLTYLPDDILVKVDRSSMAVSLETRLPFLDIDVLEFAWSLPLEYKVSQGVGKILPRQLLAEYIPSKLFERPKQGFAVPIIEWLQGPLREWGNSLLDAKKIKEQGVFNSESISNLWQNIQSGKVYEPNGIWNILMFQLWYESNHSNTRLHK
ncbi:asparagine synthase (glutamine-hydrolyzing) [Gammaproteobacteria bacterium]|nr:asparagine synthase (glutamine-hydrolyzing) [Gammaproteobacteria bacterium]